MTWHTMDTMPERGERVLLWRGLHDDDGGFPAIARVGIYKGDILILYKSDDEDWQELTRDEYPGTMWARIPKPGGGDREMRLTTDPNGIFHSITSIIDDKTSRRDKDIELMRIGYLFGSYMADNDRMSQMINLLINSITVETTITKEQTLQERDEEVDA